MEAEDRGWMAALYAECDMGVANYIAGEVQKCIADAASQAREQALLEAETQIRSLGGEFDEWIYSKRNGAEFALAKAVALVSSLATPEAQAQVQRRIVAGWIWKWIGPVKDGIESGRPVGVRGLSDLNAVERMLAALKEQE